MLFPGCNLPRGAVIELKKKTTRRKCTIACEESLHSNHSVTNLQERPHNLWSVELDMDIVLYSSNISTVIESATDGKLLN